MAGGLDALLGSFRRGDLADLARGLDDGSIDPNDVNAKIAAITGDPNDIRAQMEQGAINQGQRLSANGQPLPGPDGQPLLLDPDASPTLPWSAQPQPLGQINMTGGQRTGNMEQYTQGRTQQAVSGALANLPAGANPLQAMTAGAMGVMQTTGDSKPLQALNTYIMEMQKNMSEVGKNNAQAGEATANTQRANFEMGGAGGAPGAPIVNPGAAGGAGAPAGGAASAVTPITNGSPVQNALNLFARSQAIENAPGDPSAVGDGGKAVGLMQTHPAAFQEGAAYAGLQNPNPANPAHQMLAGQGYWAKQLDAFGNDPVKATIAYNAGPSVAANWDGNYNSLPPQTQAYLGKMFGQQPGAAPAPAAAGADTPMPGAAPLSGQAAQTAALTATQKQQDIAAHGAEQTQDVTAAGQKKAGEENATNAASAQKALATILGSYQQVNDRFQQMSDANKIADFSFLNGADGDGVLQYIHQARTGANGLTGDPVSTANSTLASLADMQVLKELGPQLAQSGVKGNKFLENIIAGASGLNLRDSQNGRQAQITAEQNNYNQAGQSLISQLKQFGVDPTPVIAQSLTNRNVLNDARQRGLISDDDVLKVIHANPAQYAK